MYISANEKLAQGTCPSLSCQNKVLFFWKASFEPNDRINAKQSRYKKKILCNMLLSSSQRNDLFRAWLCYGELRVCLGWKRLCCFIDIGYSMCIVYGFCNWLIDLWPIKRYTTERGGGPANQRIQKTLWSFKLWWVHLHFCDFLPEHMQSKPLLFAYKMHNLLPNMQKFSTRAKMCSIVFVGKMHRARTMESALFLVTFTVYCCEFKLQNTTACA